MTSLLSCLYYGFTGFIFVKLPKLVSARVPLLAYLDKCLCMGQGRGREGREEGNRERERELGERKEG